MFYSIFYIGIGGSKLILSHTGRTLEDGHNDNTASSSDDESAVDGLEVAERKIHDINITSLWAMDSNDKKTKKCNAYETNGMDPDRIRGVLIPSSGCICKCEKKVSYRKLKDICDAFWRLDKEHQDKALWSAQCCGDCRRERAPCDSSSDSSSSEHMDQKRRMRRPWLLAGISVCRHAFYRLLGSQSMGE